LVLILVASTQALPSFNATQENRFFAAFVMQDPLTAGNDEQNHIHISCAEHCIPWGSLNLLFGRWILLIEGSQSSLAHLDYGHTLLQDLGIREGLTVFAGRLATKQSQRNAE
jgi:hypothetical protein